MDSYAEQLEQVLTLIESKTDTNEIERILEKECVEKVTKSSKKKKEKEQIESEIVDNDEDFTERPPDYYNLDDDTRRAIDKQVCFIYFQFLINLISNLCCRLQRIA